jgi:hypothetical protein
MWPSYDVHKVMVEQVELTKKQDFLYLMNQVQARLLLHASKKPIYPENGACEGEVFRVGLVLFGFGLDFFLSISLFFYIMYY